MKRSSACLVLATIIAIAVTFPLHLEGQAWVYVNDNYQAVGANTVSLFHFTGPALSYISPYATTSTGIAFRPVPNQVVAAAYSSTVGCVFASDPLGDASFPTGDVAAFKVHAGGALVRVGNYDDPTNISGNNDLLTLAIDRRAGEPLLFASYQAESKIASYKINTSTCALTWVSSTPATGLKNGWAIAMAVDNTPNNNDVLVVSYGDGSIQSFKNAGGFLTPTPAILSAGFIGHRAVPQGLDITENGKWAVFADSNGPATELEVAPILTGGLGPTTDYPGLNAAQGSENVWLSPGTVGSKYYVYVTNNTSGDVSTFKISAAGIITPAGACGTGYTNPTPLNASLWSFPAGLHTTGTTTASGGNLVVTEFGLPSSVALLKIQNATGCTAEVPGSPFADSNSNNGLNSVDVLPSRPY
jgi:hypothetical protein